MTVEVPELSICILNWNGGKFLSRCLESIYNSRISLSFEIILIDNQSTDGSFNRVKEKYPKLITILNSENSGFSKGNNLALKVCKGQNVLLLNPDTIVYQDSLEQMVSFLDTVPAAGICGCSLRHPDTNVLESSARSFPTLVPLLFNLTYLDRLFPRSHFFSHYQMTYLDFSATTQCPTEVDWVTGACLMIRKEAMNQIGTLDEKLFMYCEDVDWCFRCKQIGMKVYYLPGILIGHFRGQSSKQRQKIQKNALSVWGAQQYAKSVIYFYSKHYGFLNTLLLRLVLVSSSLIKAFLWLVKGMVTLEIFSSLVRARSYLSIIPVALGKNNVLYTQNIEEKTI